MRRKYLRKPTYLRDCERCDKPFNALTKYGKICERCKKESKEEHHKKMQDIHLKNKKIKLGIQ